MVPSSSYIDYTDIKLYIGYKWRRIVATAEREEHNRAERGTIRIGAAVNPHRNDASSALAYLPAIGYIVQVFYSLHIMGIMGMMAATELSRTTAGPAAAAAAALGLPPPPSLDDDGWLRLCCCCCCSCAVEQKF